MIGVELDQYINWDGLFFSHALDLDLVVRIIGVELDQYIIGMNYFLVMP